MNAAEAITKLQSLSAERAGKVVALIEDLAELEALEDAEDLKDARESLAEIEKARESLLSDGQSAARENPEQAGTVPYEQLRAEAGLGVGCTGSSSANGAARAYRKLPPNVRRRLDASILGLADDPRPAGCVKLSGTESIWRIRVGGLSTDLSNSG